jgi:tRNA dimethylallyltransferase
MIAQGLLTEAERVLEPYHNEPLPNSLNTVGYKELFKVKTGEWTEDFAISMIKQNSRRYAKRQLTWLRHDKDIHWLNINDYETTQDITLAICNMLCSMS